jgi:hypothetical protein
VKEDELKDENNQDIKTEETKPVVRKIALSRLRGFLWSKREVAVLFCLVEKYGRNF